MVCSVGPCPSLSAVLTAGSGGSCDTVSHLFSLYCSVILSNIYVHFMYECIVHADYMHVDIHALLVHFGVFFLICIFGGVF